MDDISKTLSKSTFTLGLHYTKGEICYSLDTPKSTYSGFESQFYTHFNDFQIVPDTKDVWNYDRYKSVVGELSLTNK
ncbi:MAG: hypothetical protein WCL18_10430 [bacterium]